MGSIKDEAGASPADNTQFVHFETVDEAPPSKDIYKSWKFWCVFVSASLGFHAALFGISPGWNLLQSRVPASLGQDETTTLAWATPTIFFTHTFSSVLFGRLSDYIGRRWVFVCGNLVSFIGFLACGRVSHGYTLSGLHTLVGLGAGVQIMGPFLALAELVPVRHRFVVSGGCITLLAPYQAMYPAIGEALAENTADSWRWCFSINAIFSFVAFIGFLVAYTPTPTKRSDAPILKRNWIGLPLVAVSTSLALFVLSGDTIYPWEEAKVIAPVVVMGILLIAVPLYEAFHGGDRAVIPGYLVRSWAVVSWVLVGALSNLLIWFIPLADTVVFQSVLGRTGMTAAWDTSTFTAGVVAGSILATAALFRPKFIKWHLVAGVIVNGVFLAGLAAARSDRLRLVQAFNTFLGIGVGYVLVVAFTTAPMTAKPQDMGCVVGTMSAFRALAWCVLRALFFAIYTPRLQSKTISFVSEGAVKAGLPQASLPAVFQALQAAQLTGDQSALLQVPGINKQILFAIQLATVDASTNAWRFIILLAIIYVGLLIILAVLCPNIDLSLEIVAHSNPAPQLQTSQNNGSKIGTGTLEFL